MQTLAIANHKGGVGKTTVTRNLAHELAARGGRVLCVDCDPQGSLGRAFGLTGVAHGLADVIGGEKAGWLLMPKAIQDAGGVAVCMAGLTLGDNERAAFARYGRENLIKKALQSVADLYDVALLDCAPSLGLLTVNALNASNGVLIVTKGGALEAAALRDFLATVDGIRAEMNHNLQIVGYVVNEHSTQSTYDTDMLSAMRDAGLNVIATIGRTVQLRRAIHAGQAIGEYDAGNTRANEFKQLGDEIHQWLRKQK